MSQGYFVTGTDTEVGKTVISVGLIKKLQQQGRRVVAMKPVASGCEMTSGGLRNEDALALHEAADIKVAYEQINPYAFAPAIAPHIAAQQAAVDIDLQRLVNVCQQLQLGLLRLSLRDAPVQTCASCAEVHSLRCRLLVSRLQGSDSEKIGHDRLEEASSRKPQTIFGKFREQGGRPSP